MIPITPQTLAAVYECLRAFPPFAKMDLLPASAVKFKIIRSKRSHGEYTRYIGTDIHFIYISAPGHHHFLSLTQTIAHEMIHLHQARAKTETRGQHNAEFKRIAARVCKTFGWDLGQF